MSDQRGVELCPSLKLIQTDPFVLRVRLRDVSRTQNQQLAKIRQNRSGGPIANRPRCPLPRQPQRLTHEIGRRVGGQPAGPNTASSGSAIEDS